MKAGKPLPSIFAVDIDGKPMVAFEADNLQNAEELTKEDWFLNDLQSLRSEGKVVWDGKSPLRARFASEEESLRFRIEAPEIPNRPSDIPLEYMAPLNGKMPTEK